MNAWNRLGLPTAFRANGAMAIGVVAIVVMLLVPLPTPILDFLIMVNLTVSLVILLVAMNVREPMEFSSFPPLLLLLTLFRLSLNVSAARLVLLNADAGLVINAFGHVMVGGNYVVGAVVFVILIVVQYVVVTSGAGRVSEVRARFNLDALPGKQMSIEADLNGGLITGDQARERRRLIERESDFYGSMDGASKFVKGDAIAAMIIIVINIVAGLAIGVLQNHLDIGTALKKYTVLTIGDGLTNEIGALLVAQAMGILVTRTSSLDGLGSDIGGQLLRWPKLIQIAGAALLLIGLVPGFPLLTFGVVGGGAILIGAWLRRQPERLLSVPTSTDNEALATQERDQPENALHVPVLQLAVGYAIVSLTEGLTERIALIRRQIASELGFIVPTVNIVDDHEIDPSSYVIRLRGADVAEGQLYPAKMLAMNSAAEEIAVDGIPVHDPIFGRPAVWISPSDETTAAALGYSVIRPITVMVTHVRAVATAHAGELIGRTETRQLLDLLKVDHAVLVDELMAAVGLGDVQRVLQHLLAEQVSIRDLRTIAEAVADTARISKEPMVLGEAARVALGRSIANGLFAPSDRLLHVYTLDRALERTLLERLVNNSGRLGLNLTGEERARLSEAIIESGRALTTAGFVPVLLCDKVLRLIIRQQVLAEKAPAHVVLSMDEIAAVSERVRSDGTVSVEL